MANKNTTGSSFVNWKKREDRLIERMTKREKSSQNAENVDPVYNKHRISKDGSKVWSF